MEEFSTLFFSGLHMHGGGLAQYDPIRTDNTLYTRITAILYPPQAVLSGHLALAFAAMPYPPDPCRACQKHKHDALRREANDDETDHDSNIDSDEEDCEEVYATSGSPKPGDPLKTSLLKLLKEWHRQGLVLFPSYNSHLMCLQSTRVIGGTEVY